MSMVIDWNTCGFLSTPSARRATRWPQLPTTASGYFYPRPPRGGRLHSDQRKGQVRSISIHALREEGDRSPWKSPTFPRYFYPRPPRGGRPSVEEQLDGQIQFLSTPSARRATTVGCSFTTCSIFLSTPSARRATHRAGQALLHQRISIHALREEGDTAYQRQESGHTNFYPRPPRGGRHPPNQSQSEHQRFLSTPSARRATGFRATQIDFLFEFLSTPSARRATGLGDKWFEDNQISIHALREEGDNLHPPKLPKRQHFYPRPPRGGRPMCWMPSGVCFRFLSTPSARRATLPSQFLEMDERISIHALREEGDLPDNPCR